MSEEKTAKPEQAPAPAPPEPAKAEPAPAPAPADPPVAAAKLVKQRLPDTYVLTRFVMLRLLGAIYAVAFLAAVNQIVPLIGANGLLPVDQFLDRARDVYGTSAGAFVRLPSLFWFAHSDTNLLIVSWVGLSLACLVVIGYANAIVMSLLWLLYMSIVHVGQDWYAYGWEMQLLETGFLAIFLCPLRDGHPLSAAPPPRAIIWLFRWLIFRIMIGAALIKLRGDTTWRDLTVLYYHFETQPIPGPLSRWFHFLPRWLLRSGVIFNFAAELVAPWLLFWPRFGRRAAAVVAILFHMTLIVSGNLSFLNWLTIVPALACLDDGFWTAFLPGRFAERARNLAAASMPGIAMQRVAWTVAIIVAVLSIRPAVNLISDRQVMNSSFDPLDLVNTYGAFGSVGRERFNVVFQGTDTAPPDNRAKWLDYSYAALPVALDRRPVQIAPYQPRLDWQMWFAAMGTPNQYPWSIHLVWKLLHNDPATLRLFEDNPFPGKPPRFVRATLYRYEFAPSGNPKGLWWERHEVGRWLPPLSADDPRLLYFMKEHHWRTDADPAAFTPAKSSH